MTGRTGRRGSAATPVAVVLLALAAVLGPGAAPADAVAGSAGAPVHASEDWGEEIRDRFGIPVTDYTIDPPEDSQVLTRLVLWLADLQLTSARFGVAVAVLLLRLALDFTLADLLLAPVQQLVEVYQGSYVGTVAGGGWGLVTLALMLCVFWFGLAALRGRVGRGAGEITLSFVLAVVLGAVLARPEVLLGEEGLYGRAKDIGVEVAVTAVRPASGHDPPRCALQASADGETYVDGCWHPDDGPAAEPPVSTDPQYLRWVMQQWLVDLYIRQPHQRMAYGQRLDCPLTLAVRQGGSTAGSDGDPCAVPYEEGGRHACVGVYNDILRADPSTVPVVDTGWEVGPTWRGPLTPHMGQTNPENYMHDMMRPGGIDGETGCDEGEALAAYLDRPHTERLAVGGVLLLAVLALVLFVLAGVVLPIFVGQVLLAVLTVALVFVLPVALLGGASRQVLWKWFGLLLAAVFMIVIALVGLALMLITTELLLRGNHQYFYASLLLATVSSLLFLLIQRRLLHGAVAAGGRAGAALGRAPSGTGAVGGAGAPVGPATTGAAAWTRTATGGVAAATGAARAPLAAWARDRQAVREYGRQQRAVRGWERRHWGQVLHRDLSQEERWQWVKQQVAGNPWQRRPRPRS